MSTQSDELYHEKHNNFAHVVHNPKRNWRCMTNKV